MRATSEAQAILRRMPLDASDLPGEAWELIARYRGELFNQAFALLGDLDEAEDAVQETFCDALKDRQRLADVQSIGAWLRSLNHANAISRRRASHCHARRVEHKRLDPAARSVTTGGFSLLEMREELAVAIEKLPELHRAVVVLRCWEGLPHEEIARRLRQPAGTVRRVFHQATVMLYERLGPQGSGPERGSGS